MSGDVPLCRSAIIADRVQRCSLPNGHDGSHQSLYGLMWDSATGREATPYEAGWCDAIRYAAQMLGDRSDDWAMHNYAAVMECVRYVESIPKSPPAREQHR